MMNFYLAHPFTPLNALFLCLLMACGAPAWANGSITHRSGPVTVQKADGQTQPAVVGTQVNAGDTVVTGVGGYARMQMTDGGEMVLRPDSQLKVESYQFVESKPAEDNFVFSMLRGGMRTITGLVSKRGNRDAYKLQTPTATVGIRGTQFDLRVCQANCGALANGTYLAVSFGAVQMSNPQGTLEVVAGKVGFAPPQQAPVQLLRNPGIGFTPPPNMPKLDEKKKAAAVTTSMSGTTQSATPQSSASPQTNLLASPQTDATSSASAVVDTGMTCSVQ